MKMMYDVRLVGRRGGGFAGAALGCCVVGIGGGIVQHRAQLVPWFLAVFGASLQLHPAAIQQADADTSSHVGVGTIAIETSLTICS